MSEIAFEPTSVTDLTMPERSVIEGANVIDYDVEYGPLPIDADQLKAPTSNIAVPAKGTLGSYETDGTGETEIYEISSATLKLGGKGYEAEEIAVIKGMSPSDTLAEIEVLTVKPKEYKVIAASAGGEMSGYVTDETITIAGETGDTSAVLTITADEDGAITGLTVTTAGKFAEDIAGAVDPTKITYAGQGTGANISVVTELNADAGEILTIDLESAGSYSRDFSGDVELSGKGSGAVVTIVMDKISPNE